MISAWWLLLLPVFGFFGFLLAALMRANAIHGEWHAQSDHHECSVHPKHYPRGPCPATECKFPLCVATLMRANGREAQEIDPDQLDWASEMALSASERQHRFKLRSYEQTRRQRAELDKVGRRESEQDGLVRDE